MPFSGAPYARAMSDLLVAGGAARANAERHRGEIWGRTMASLGHIPERVMAMRQAEQDRAMALQDRERETTLRNTQQQAANMTLQGQQAAANTLRRVEEILSRAPDLPSALTELERIDPKLALELQRGLLTTGAAKVEAIARLAPTVTNQPSHTAARQKLTSLGVQVPLDYSPEWWDASVMDAMTLKEQIDLTRQQRADRQAENQQGVRRMIGESLVQRGGQPLESGDVQTLEGIAMQEGVSLPSALTRAPQPTTSQTHMARLPGVGDVPVDYIPGRQGEPGRWMYQGQDVTGKVSQIPPASIRIDTARRGREEVDPEAVGEMRDVIERVKVSLPAQRRGQFVQLVSRLVSEGNADGAKDVIRQNALESEGVDLKNQILGRANTAATLAQVRAILTDMQQRGVPTNWLTGNIENLRRRLGTTGNQEYVRLGAQLRDALIVYRRAATGVQFGEREERQYETLFPNYKNTYDVNIGLIDGLLNAITVNDATYWTHKLGRDGARLVGVGQPRAGAGEPAAQRPPAGAGVAPTFNPFDPARNRR